MIESKWLSNILLLKWTLFHQLLNVLLYISILFPFLLMFPYHFEFINIELQLLLVLIIPLLLLFQYFKHLWFVLIILTVLHYFLWYLFFKTFELVTVYLNIKYRCFIHSIQFVFLLSCVLILWSINLFQIITTFINWHILIIIKTIILFHSLLLHLLLLHHHLLLHPLPLLLSDIS